MKEPEKLRLQNNDSDLLVWHSDFLGQVLDLRQDGQADKYFSLHFPNIPLFGGVTVERKESLERYKSVKLPTHVTREARRARSHLRWLQKSRSVPQYAANHE
jgi:hypothetical protein